MSLICIAVLLSKDIQQYYNDVVLHCPQVQNSPWLCHKGLFTISFLHWTLNRLSYNAMEQNNIGWVATKSAGRSNWSHEPSIPSNHSQTPFKCNWSNIGISHLIWIQIQINEMKIHINKTNTNTHHSHPTIVQPFQMQLVKHCNALEYLMLHGYK